MLLNADDCALMIVDVQTRLLPALPDAQSTVARVAWLAELADTLNIPTVITEHCVDKIGSTDARVMAAAPAAFVVQKQDFSAWAEGCIQPGMLGSAQQVVLAGIEAHVCVMQTAIDLQRHGFWVYVVAEAVASREDSDKALALTRMRDNGCEIISGEMVAFEWLTSARHPQFKEVHSRFIR